MALRDRDIETLFAARDDRCGDLNRNSVIEAFKRAGACVVRDPQTHQVRIQYRGRLRYDLPLGNGPVDLTGRHPTFRRTLEDLAGDLIQKQGLEIGLSG